jgi:hypothetical protein
MKHLPNGLNASGRSGRECAGFVYDANCFSWFESPRTRTTRLIEIFSG